VAIKAIPYFFVLQSNIFKLNPYAMASSTLNLVIAALFLHLGIASASNDRPAKNIEKKTVLKRECLEIAGTAMSKGITLKQVAVKLYKGDQLVAQIPTTRKEKVFFVLEENCAYTLVYSKPGYVDRMIQVDTKLPDKTKLEPIFTLEFEVEMMPENKTNESDILDFPAGIVYYNKASDKFEDSRTYTSRLQSLAGNTNRYAGITSGK
jgi:hypothetical protein